MKTDNLTPGQADKMENITGNKAALDMEKLEKLPYTAENNLDVTYHRQSVRYLDIAVTSLCGAVHSTHHSTDQNGTAAH